MPKFDKPDSPNIIWGVNALDADLTRPDDSYIQTGWTQVKPPYEYENYSMNKLYQGFAYYNQLGFPEWDSVTEYQAGKSYVQGSNNRVYKCIQTHTNRNPATAGNESWWERLIVTEGQINGLFNNSLETNGYQTLPGGLLMQWGEITVSLATGTQIVTLPTPMPTAVLQQFAHDPNSGLATSDNYFIVSATKNDNSSIKIDWQRISGTTSISVINYFVIGH